MCLSSLRFQASAHCSFPAQSSESSCKHILRQPNCSAHRGQHPIAHPALSPPAGPPWKRHRWELTAQRRLKVIFGPNRALCGCICDEHNRYETIRKNVRLFFINFSDSLPRCWRSFSPTHSLCHSAPAVSLRQTKLSFLVSLLQHRYKLGIWNKPSKNTTGRDL